MVHRGRGQISCVLLNPVGFFKQKTSASMLFENFLLHLLKNGTISNFLQNVITDFFQNHLTLNITKFYVRQKCLKMFLGLELLQGRRFVENDNTTFLFLVRCRDHWSLWSVTSYFCVTFSLRLGTFHGTYPLYLNNHVRSYLPTVSTDLGLHSFHNFADHYFWQQVALGTPSQSYP